jgi:hypothetical protein
MVSKEYAKLFSEGKKKCPGCKEIKELTNFYYVSTTDTYISRCKDCTTECKRKRVPLLKETELRYELHNQQLRKCYSCQIVKPYSDYGISSTAFYGIQGMCKSCKSIKSKELRENPKFRQKRLDKKKEYYERIKDTEEYKEKQRLSREKRDYKERYKKSSSDEFQRYKSIIRHTITSPYRNRKKWVRKDSKSVEILGANYFVVKEFITRQFLKGMTWENYGKVWQIDHVIPLDSAGKDPEKLKRLCYYENLSPLWSMDNIRKGAKVPNICTLWSNPILPYKEFDLVVIPEHTGIIKSHIHVEPGTRYGLLTVLYEGDPKVPNSVGTENRMITCKCDCGNVRVTSLYSLIKSFAKSCGCLKRKLISEKTIYRKLLFSDKELLELIEFTKIHPKGVSIPTHIIQKYEGRTHKQIKNVLNAIRNKTLKRLNYLNNTN